MKHDLLVYDLIQVTRGEFERQESFEKVKELIRAKADLAVASIINRLEENGYATRKSHQR